MGVLTHLTWGDSWRRPKEGLGRVVDAIQKKSMNMPKPADADDPSIDIYIYVSGAVWQHEDHGFKLGTLSARGRSWLRVMIYVPDHLTGQDESEMYFTTTLEEVALAVEARLRKRRPDLAHRGLGRTDPSTEASRLNSRICRDPHGRADVRASPPATLRPWALRLRG